MISSALFEELIEDTRGLTRSLVQYADRWSKYGDKLKDQASPSQLEELDVVLNEFLSAIKELG